MKYTSFKIKGIDFYTIMQDDKIIYLDTSYDFAGLSSPLKKILLSCNIQYNDTGFEVIKKQLQEYFDGKRKVLDFSIHAYGTEFQQKVWQILLDIEYGTTLSYFEVARLIGDTKKVRAVANAIGKNPILIRVPCHRVIGKNNKLVGFSSGLELKQLLLDIEK